LGFVEGSIAEHGEEDVGPASGEEEQGLGVVLALGDLLVVVGPGGRSPRAANAERKKARSSCLFPRLDGCSPRIDKAELRVAGARPA
jgi:hypothetical protein